MRLLPLRFPLSNLREPCTGNVYGLVSLSQSRRPAARRFLPHECQFEGNRPARPGRRDPFAGPRGHAREHHRGGARGIRANTGSPARESTRSPRKTKSSKRMIYYYFGDKEGLYLKGPRGRLQQGPRRRGDAASRRPGAASRRSESWWNSPSTTTIRNQDFIRLVMIENIHHGEYLVPFQGDPGAERHGHRHDLEHLRARREGGAVRPGLDPIDLHWQISALCFFNVSNRATFSLASSRAT